MSTRNQRITATAWTYAAAGLAVSTNAAQSAVVDYHRAEDHNTGIHVLQDLHEYLASDRLVGKYLYLKFVEQPLVLSLLNEMDAVGEHWHDLQQGGRREDFDRMHDMRSDHFI